MSLGLFNADMDPRYPVIPAPVYSPIPVYTFDDDDRFSEDNEDDEAWRDEVNPTPPLFMKCGMNGVMTFVIDPLAWLLYVIEEETKEDLMEFEMQVDREFWDKAAA